MADETLTTGEAGKLLGVTARRVHQMVVAGEIEATQTAGGHWRIPRGAVSRKLKERLWESAKLARIARETPAGMFTLEANDDATQREIGRLEGKIEVMREDLQRERERADRLQAELDKLRGHGG